MARVRTLALGAVTGAAGAIGVVVLAGCALSPATRSLFAEAGPVGVVMVLWAACSAAAPILLVLHSGRPRAEALGAGQERQP